MFNKILNYSGFPSNFGKPGKIVALAVLMVASFCITVTAQSTVTPARYWTFNGSNPATDSMGVFNLNFTTYNSPYTIGSSGQVNKFLTLASNSALIDGGPLTLNNALTVEMLIKPGYLFNSSKIMRRGDDAFSIRMEYARIIFSTTHKTSSGAIISDEFAVDLNGIGRKSYGYYVDNNWHHMVFKFDGASGTKEIWVDGQLPAGFSKTIATGTFANAGNTSVYLNHTISYVKYFGSLDEIALYTSAIPSSLIYKHYLGIQNGTPYSFANNYSGSVPAAASVAGAMDQTEYAPGHPNVTVSATDQILTFPVPRYKTGHTLLPNVPLYGIEYLAGLLQPGYNYSNVLNSAKTQQIDLINNFNQSILVTSNTHEYVYMDDTTKFAGWFLRYANQNPSKHASAFTFWPQVDPSIIGRNSTNAYATCNCLSNNHYLRNSSGQFLDLSGNVTGSKFLSPAAPVDSLIYDGLTQKYYLQQMVNRMSRPLNLLFENGEAIPFFNSGTTLSKDPAVLSDKSNTGLDWPSYEGRRAKEKVLAYRNQFMSLSQLSNTKFAYFQVDGQPTWRLKYDEMRQTNTQINGQYYPTGDIYMRYPDNWRYWSSAWHGWQWLAESRKVELALGDKLFSPPVAAGWDADETKNVRPAQWLGMLKAISMAGAEYFYPSFFSTTAPFQDSKNWAWQVVMPAYSQAISSRYEDFFRNGYLMEGDVPDNYATPSYNAYSFKSGDLRKLVVVRKHNTIAKYAITGTLQPNSNMQGNAENSGVATITLDGQSVKFNVRRQGSTYIYDKSNASAPVFYQLDGWHEASHPYFWSKDFNLEAELFDNTNSNVVIKTSVPAGTTAGDYTNYTSYVSFNAVADVVYNFYPRKSAPTTDYLWVRARSKDRTSTGFTVRLDNGTANVFDCIVDTNWVWYRYNTANSPVSYSGLTNASHELKITASNTKIEIDQIVLTNNSGAVYGNVTNPCTTSQASISTSGSTTFCQGGSVSLTASNGTTYLWSNGATSKTITVTSSGTYTVTVTTTGIGSSTASPITVTVNSLPIANITTSGATTFCSPGSVTLTATAGSSYLWSPGNQTTQAITASTSGTYNVRVTNSNGCTKVSSNSVVTANAAPVATITPNGSLTILQGANVTLSASTGSSYLWLPGGQTSQSIVVNTAGSYTVRVSNSSGCSTTSAAAVVTVLPNSSATVTASGPVSFCQGGSVTLTASNGTSYSWSNGANTKSITVNTSGTYTATVYNGATPAIASPVVVTVWSLPSATVSAGSATSFCSGGYVNLNSNQNNSYSWSPGGATTQTLQVFASGNYFVTVSNSYGCTATSTIVPVTVTNCNTTCDPPTGLITNNVSANSATVSWTNPNSGQTQFQVKLKNKNTNYVYVTGQVPASTTTITVGANANTTYNWWVRSWCSGTKSNYAGFLSFNTPNIRTGDPVIETIGEITPAYLSDDPEDNSEMTIYLDKDEMQVFPNPSSVEANIAFQTPSDQDFTVSLMELNGKLIFTEKVEAKQGYNIHPLDISTLSKGIYLVQLTGNSKSILRKLAVQ